MGFDIKGTVDQGLDKAKDVVTDEHVDKAGEAVNENVQKLTDKFGK